MFIYLYVCIYMFVYRSKSKSKSNLFKDSTLVHWYVITIFILTLYIIQMVHLNFYKVCLWTTEVLYSINIDILLI